METDQAKKQEALKIALTQLEKQFGKGTVMRLGDTTKLAIECVPMGSL